MKMHSLGERIGGSSVPGPPSKRKRPARYYPSVTVDDVDALNSVPLGKETRFQVDGLVKRHSVENSDSGRRTTTTIELRSIGVPEKARGAYVCDGCGTKGGRGHCATCGGAMRKRT